MGQSAAKQGDRITAMDTHIVTSNPPTVTLPFNGILNGALSRDVRIGGMPAATVDSSADNVPPHVGSFVHPPSNRGTIKFGSASVKINGKGAARNGDIAQTCNDPVDLPAGTVVASGIVRIGG
jgi:uncharacterized Zn-binding protein involved in type VI secretion